MPRERSRKKRLHYEHILSDISDGSGTNFIYILLASECQQRNNGEHFKTNKTSNEITVCLQTNNKSQFVYKLLGHVTKLLGSNFFDPKKNESALAGTSRLVKDRHENQDRSKSAPQLNSAQVTYNPGVG